MTRIFMNAFRKITIVLVFALVMFSFSGCGIVKIIPAGTEAEYTGEKVFDASSEAATDWEKICAEIVGAGSASLKDVLASGLAKDTSYSVTLTGTVKEYNTDTPKGFLLIEADGVDKEVRVQVGKIFTGTAVRDCQTLKAFGDFTNQTEWSAYAKTINSEVLTNVIVPLGDLNSLVGKTAEITGCFASASADPVLLTPVQITIK